MALRDQDILFPVGRMVMGSLYELQHTDAEGKPRLFKKGPNIGKPNPIYFFALAIPKVAGHTHWSQTEWGQKIWVCGHTQYPKIAERPDFAWKIVDGDSAIPNKKGTAPNTREGYPGHWVLTFNTSWALKIVNAMTQPVTALTEVDAIKPGYYIEVLGSVVPGERDSQQPSVHLNPNGVALRGFGKEIYTGIDLTTVGFGASAVPTGASSVPTASAMATSVPGTATATPPPPATVAATPTAAPLPVTPHPTILNAAVDAPPPPTGKVMTAKAAGATYESFTGKGWTDALLVQHGYMLP